MSATPNDELAELELYGLKEKMRELDAKIEELTAEKTKKLEERNNANQEMKRIKERVQQLKSEKESVMNEIRAERDELRSHRRQLLALILESKNLKNELRGLRLPSDISEVKRKLDEIDYYLSSHRVGRGEERRLFEQASKLEAILREYEKALKLKGQLAKLSPDVERLRSIIEEKKARLDELNGKLNSIKEELKALNAKYDELKRIANEAHEEYLRIKKEISTLEAERILAESRFYELQRQLKGKREERFRRKILELREKMKKEAQEKLARGEKVGFEELKVLLEDDPSWFLEMER